jgi:glycolate oxidase
MLMPPPDAAAIARRSDLIKGLSTILASERVIVDEHELVVYESDGLTAYRQPPMVVALPDTTDQVAKILRLCRALAIKVIPRGAGTSLSGGALPTADGLVLAMARFNRILGVDIPNRTAIVQPGVTNAAISRAVEGAGFYYAPDPSSQIACTIGGNVAENSGGVHCLKYGVTTNNVLGVEFVTIDGEVLRLGGEVLGSPGYDLLGLVVGSEGLLGVVTEVTVRILAKPETAQALLVGFPTITAAAESVAAIIASGIIPAGMEMMDKPAINAAEDFIGTGYPRHAEALLIVELDGPAVEVDHLVKRVEAIVLDRGADFLKISSSEGERLAFWAGRKAAFPAIGRISPDYYVMDGTIPRRRLTDVLQGIADLSRAHGLAVANVFHAGDGNLHPMILYDANQANQLQRAEAMGAEILKLCVRVGGVLSGEHGIGVEKRDLMTEQFGPIDLAQQQRVKEAFDPAGLFNPGKVFPLLHSCGETTRRVRSGRIPAIPGAAVF